MYHEHVPLSQMLLCEQSTHLLAIRALIIADVYRMRLLNLYLSRWIEFQTGCVHITGHSCRKACTCLAVTGYFVASVFALASRTFKPSLAIPVTQLAPVAKSGIPVKGQENLVSAHLSTRICFKNFSMQC